MEALNSADVSVFPLAIPILAGPGAMASVVLYMSLAGTDIRKIGSVLVSVALSLAAGILASDWGG